MHMKLKMRPNTARISSTIELPVAAEQAQAVAVLQELQAQERAQEQAQAPE